MSITVKFTDGPLEGKHELPLDDAPEIVPLTRDNEITSTLVQDHPSLLPRYVRVAGPRGRTYEYAVRAPDAPDPLAEK